MQDSFVAVFFPSLLKQIFNSSYRVFHRFGQAKFADGGSILGLRQL